MPTASCACGAKYKVPETSLGKKAKCKKCGAVFTLETNGGGVIPLAPPEDDFSSAFASEVAAAAVAGPVARAAAVPSVIAAAPAPAAASPPLTARASPAKGFGDSVLWTVLFPASPENLLTFIAIWLGVGIGGVLPLVSILVSLWYAAFRFELVESAAGGDENLPSVSMGTDIWADWVAPALKWAGTWLLVFLPAFIHIVFQASSGTSDPTQALFAMLGGINGIFDAFGTDPLLVVLIGAGLFMWPMVILCVSLGGFASAFRVDLMVITILRGFPGYLVVLGLVMGATVAEYYINELVLAKMAPPAGAGLGGILGRFMIIRFLVIGATLYADIVSLRSIGLFYRHFKHKFAYNWG